MDYRRKRTDDDSDSSDKEEVDSSLNNTKDSSDNDEGPAAKKAARLWGDVLMEESLMQRGSQISLRRESRNHVSRGPESYTVNPNHNFQEKSNRGAECDANATLSSADPFDDAPVDLSCETAFCERVSFSNWYSDGQKAVRNATGIRRGNNFAATSSRGKGPAGRPRDSFGGGQRGGGGNRGGGNSLKRHWTGSRVSDPAELLTPSYSPETLMAVEFASDITLDQLGDEIAKAMGERDPRTVKSIVAICGIEKALALFEETRKVESTGGMMVESGRRRRTPGGVFITLFKLDPEVAEDVKSKLFGQYKHEARKLCRARRRNNHKNTTESGKSGDNTKKKVEEGAVEEPLKPLPTVEEEFCKQSAEAVMEDIDDIVADEMMS